MKKGIILFTVILSLLLMGFQVLSTQLKLNIRNNLGKPEEGVKVRIYVNEEDYNKDQNYVQEHYTDSKGNVSFKELNPIKYYISAVKDNKTNAGNGVVTDILKEFKVNKMLVIIQE
jgi:uncharacterized protein (DUF2141 family)